MNQSNETFATGSNHLTPEQLDLINRALGSIPDFGEVRLIIEKGKLRFLVVQKSYDAINIPSDGDEKIDL